VRHRDRRQPHKRYFIDRLDVRLAAFTHVSNVLGTINPVAEIVERAQAAGARVLLDGAQAAPHLPVDVAALGADFYAFSGHKLGAPTGIGVLYGRREVLEPLEPFFGGSEIIREVWLDRATWNDLPWRFEPGTPPIAGAVGLGAAIDYVEGLGRETVRQHDTELVQETLARLGEVEDLELYGPRDPEIRAGVFSFNFPGVHPHDLSAALDDHLVLVTALLAIPITAFLLFRTAWGLNLRTVGENPRAADAAGVSVWSVRTQALALGGAMMALGGAYLTIAQFNAFTFGVVSGRGWVSIALVVFGQWMRGSL
jgi:selenocysteine lyase/cysteine desulfurase